MLESESVKASQIRDILPLRRAFYMREAIFVLAAIGVIFDIAMGQSLVDDLVDPIARTGVVEFGLTLLIAGNLFLFRAIMARVIVTDEQVIVRNVMRTRSYSWDEIDRFTIEPSGMSPLIGVLNLKNGEKRRATGLQAPNPLGRPNNRNAHKLVDELNLLLEYTKQHGGSLAGAPASSSASAPITEQPKAKEPPA